MGAGAIPDAPARRPAKPRVVSARLEAPVVYGLLVLVTLGLVAFGLVMVYSASSARAAISEGDPAYYL